MRFGKMSNKLWTLIGGCYAAYAIVLFMAAISPCPANTITQTKAVAQANQSPPLSGKRLYLVDPKAERTHYWLTLWTIRNCPACERQKALVPTLEADGYHVIVRQVPGARWIKSFPAIVITKDKPGGDILHILYGIQTTQTLDKILKIGEAPESPEDPETPDYNITFPWCEHVLR